jgi:hypothetical protein
MLTIEEAREKAQQKLLEMADALPGREFVILNDRILEGTRGWMFPYNTKQFIETKNPLDGVVGNGPIFVDRQNGNLYVLPSGGYRRWLEEYDRTGVPPRITGEMRWVSSGAAPEFPLPHPRKPGS